MENPEINVIPKPEKIFRDKTEKVDISTTFYSELENEDVNKDKAKRKLQIQDKETKEQLGALYFNEINNSFEIKEVVGTGVGLALYKELIDLAKNKNLESIKSDCTVQGGAIAIWKKLAEEGNLLKIHPMVVEKFREFSKIYDEGKIFKEVLEVPSGESVFELVLSN